jgi:hypothetical protein
MRSNNGRKSAIFLEKKVSTQKKTNSVTSKKEPRKIIAVNEEKKTSSSFRAIDLMLAKLSPPSFS